MAQILAAAVWHAVFRESRRMTATEVGPFLCGIAHKLLDGRNRKREAMNDKLAHRLPADLSVISAAAGEAMEHISSQIAEAGGAIAEQIARHLDEAMKPAARAIAEEFGRRIAETVGPAVRGLVESLNSISGAVSAAAEASADRAQTLKGFTCQN